MADLGKTSMVYRFQSGPTIYGPKPLKWLTEAYGQRPDCSASPADSAAVPASWLPVTEWVSRFQKSPPTSLQLTKLRDLAVQFDPTTITTLEAAALIKSGTGARAATPNLKKKAKSLGLHFPSTVTRQTLSSLIDDAERSIVLATVRQRGAQLPDNAEWPVLDAYRTAIEDVESGIEQAHERGLDLTFPTTHSLEQLSALATSLEEFWSAAGDIPDTFREMRDEERITHIPSKAAIKASLPFLFDLIVSGRWGTANGTFLDLATHALQLDSMSSAG